MRRTLRDPRLLAATAAVVLGQLFPAAPLRALTGGSLDGFSLAAPPLYVALAPWTLLSDRLSLMDVEQLWIFLAWLILGAGAWRVVLWRGRARWTTGARLKAEIAFWVFYLLAVATLVAGTLWWRRPAAALRVADPALLVFEMHRHSSKSWDGAPGAAPESVGRAQSRLGMRAGFLTDHNRIDGALLARKAHPGPYAEAGFVSLVGNELSLHDLHAVTLGCVEEIKGDDHPGPDGLARAFARVRACGGVSIASLPEYRRHYWNDLERLIGAGIDGFEILNGTPKGLRLRAAEVERVLALARAKNLPVFAAGDSHGWGSTAVGWNVTRLPGWEELRSRELQRAVLAEWRDKGSPAVRVVARARFERAASPVLAAFDPLGQLAVTLRTAPPAAALALLLWLWIPAAWVRRSD